MSQIPRRHGKRVKGEHFNPQLEHFNPQFTCHMHDIYICNLENIYIYLYVCIHIYTCRYTHKYVYTCISLIVRIYNIKCVQREYFNSQFICHTHVRDTSHTDRRYADIYIPTTTHRWPPQASLESADIYIFTCRIWRI